MTKTINHFKDLLNIEGCKELIKKTREDEICILLPHYSINIQMRYNNDNSDPEQINWDFDELENELGQTLFVNDYDDLCCDPHGIMNED